jgi:formate/nitrite transporter FocA (FNT family)
LIFSLLKIRKKTSAVIAGLLIGGACLWGIAMWQDISPRQLFSILLGSFAFIFGIMLLALCLIALAKLLGRLVKPGDKGD